MINKLHSIIGKINGLLLVIFYMFTICYLELVYKVWNNLPIDFDFLFPVLFSIPISILLYLITSVFPLKARGFITYCFVVFLTLIFAIQLIYKKIFQVPLSLYSLVGTRDALQFGDVVTSTIINNWIAILLLLIPLLLLIILSIFRCKTNRIAKPNDLTSPILDEPIFKQTNILSTGLSMVFYILTFLIALLCVNTTGSSPVSQKTLYYQTSSMTLSFQKLGVLTSMRLDLERLFFEPSEPVMASTQAVTIPVSSQYTSNENDTQTHDKSPVYDDNTTVTPEPEEEYIPPSPNVMDIDFEYLINNENNGTIRDMHMYFSSVEPTYQNEYTGFFKGCNLIFITAEGFSHYAIHKELTPTLYKMANEGFVFNNFYNPVWGVSTTDGEYVACTGLIPKSGVWSFSLSSNNYLPFAMGNQFKELGYSTRAYHNHYYTYYDRHLSHPNMGYDFKGLGNGLNVKETWPESDLEMAMLTAPEFITLEPFHAYFMTVSGHLKYNFSGNYIAGKNKSYVESLPYSQGAKAYIASQMELEFALAYLIEELDKAGVLDNTVFVISADHYPYGLEKKDLDELAGHKVENNFELYKSALIIWKNGMNPIIVDKPCSSLDIIPTVSNLFGLEYDSRLLMGSDILSDSTPLVVFYNRSWITDRASYNSTTNTVTFHDGTEYDDAYVQLVHQAVADKFSYSQKILDTDYYRILFNTK